MSKELKPILALSRRRCGGGGRGGWDAYLDRFCCATLVLLCIIFLIAKC